MCAKYRKRWDMWTLFASQTVNLWHTHHDHSAHVVLSSLTLNTDLNIMIWYTIKSSVFYCHLSLVKSYPCLFADNEFIQCQFIYQGVNREDDQVTPRPSESYVLDDWTYFQGPIRCDSTTIYHCFLVFHNFIKHRPFLPRWLSTFVNWYPVESVDVQSIQCLASPIRRPRITTRC